MTMSEGLSWLRDETAEPWCPIPGDEPEHDVIRMGFGPPDDEGEDEEDDDA
jgi:hypothetical protein